MHLDSQDLMEVGFWIKRWVRAPVWWRTEREWVIGNQGSLTREEGRIVAWVRRRIAAGEGGVAGAQEVSPETEREVVAREKQSLASGSGREKIF
jgi:hypothetical protein